MVCQWNNIVLPLSNYCRGRTACIIILALYDSIRSNLIREAHMLNNGFDTLSGIDKVGYILSNADIIF
jgi:hypothetical protein